MIQTILNGLVGDGGVLRVRGAIALMVTGTACYLVIDGTLPLDIFAPIWSLIVGTYFGARIATGGSGG